MKKIYFIFAAICIFTACKKETVQPPQLQTCMKYAMTQCADPWGYQAGQADSVTINQYFNTRNIAATYNRIVQVYPGMVCAACNCLSGKTLYVDVTAQDTNKLKAIGFVSCNTNSVNAQPNALTETWDYVWVSGGFGGISQSMVNEHKWVIFSTTGIATFYTNSTITTQTNYTITAKDSAFWGDHGINYTPATGIFLSQNFSIRNDSLSLYDNAADGFIYTLKRR